jgi:hypothetical protein
MGVDMLLVIGRSTWRGLCFGELQTHDAQSDKEAIVPLLGLGLVRRRVEFDRSIHPFRDLEEQDILVNISLAGPDEFGKVASSHLQLTRQLKSTNVQFKGRMQVKNGAEKNVKIFDQEQEMGGRHLDESVAPKGLVYCLMVSRKLLSDTAAVLLLESTGKDNEYRRIGVGEIRPRVYVRGAQLHFQLEKWLEDALKIRLTVINFLGLSVLKFESHLKYKYNNVHISVELSKSTKSLLGSLKEHL